jgi:ferredoxin
MPRFPIIKIDYKKCTTPFDCKKCLQECPQAVFFVMPIKEEKFKETDPKEPGAYMLVAPYRRKCIACDICIDVCPVDAITIEI